MFDHRSYRDSRDTKHTSHIQASLARVIRVFDSEDTFDPLSTPNFISVYNDNDSFVDGDAKFYGAVAFKIEDTLSVDTLYYAFPFDKNNFTFPIVGETVLVLNITGQYFWLPFSVTQYPNYRQNYKINEKYKFVEIKDSNTSAKSNEYNKKSQSGVSHQNGATGDADIVINYTVNEKIKFLKPYTGDTIITGRVGNSIRFSEFFLSDNRKKSHPAIIIRNGQDPVLDDTPIGTLVVEDINKDGSSIYMTSGETKVPFLETVEKDKVAFEDYPSSEGLVGHQIHINSDRIVLSAKATEFIIFGKGNTGIFTDGQFSVDSDRGVRIHTNGNVTIHSAGSNQIFLNSENGKIFLGKNTGEGGAGSDVQNMVLGGELLDILTELIDTIVKQVYLTPAGPSGTGPTNIAQFNSIKSKLKTILSAKNFLSKD
jgi:hypothetical protein